jgi:hypothetical protein
MMTFELNCGWDFRFENTAKRLTVRDGMSRVQ